MKQVLRSRTGAGQKPLNILTVAEIEQIHNVLCADFADSDDPISPSGVKDPDLLQSAIFRQLTGYGGHFKHPTPYANAATLCYGLALNHAFNNGNKRVALVAMLCHLDRNDLTISEGVSQADLYDLMLRIASHDLGVTETGAGRADAEVAAIADWLRRNTRRVERGERFVTYRELKTILGRYGIQFENLSGNHVDVVRYYESDRFLGFGKKVVRERVTRIPYPKDGAVVARRLVTQVREACRLTEQHGIDSKIFYANERPIDYFVATYQKTLKMLART